MDLDEQIKLATKKVLELQKTGYKGLALVEAMEPYEHLQNLIFLKISSMALKAKR